MTGGGEGGDVRGVMNGKQKGKTINMGGRGVVKRRTEIDGRRREEEGGSEVGEVGRKDCRVQSQLFTKKNCLRCCV